MSAVGRQRPGFLLLSLGLALAGLGGCATRARPTLAASPPDAASLYVDCRGPRSASPTVILESGAFGASADWSLVEADLAMGGRVCAYDRSGLGRSPPRPGPKDAVAIAQELRGLLDHLGETRPVILVGHSNGALYVQTFAALWPQRVAGLVYVNGVTTDDLDHPALIADLTQERRWAGLAATAGQAGLAPAVAAFLTRRSGIDEAAARRKREGLADPAALAAASDEDHAVIPSLEQTRALCGPSAEAMAAIPTAVIVGATDPEAPLARDWHEAETASAKRARFGWVLDAPGATHTSPLSRDRSYVLAAVNWLRRADAARTQP